MEECPSTWLVVEEGIHIEEHPCARQNEDCTIFKLKSYNPHIRYHTDAIQIYDLWTIKCLQSLSNPFWVFFDYSNQRKST